MARKSKNNPNAEKSNFGAASEIAPDETIPVEVENHNPETQSLGDRLKEKLTSVVQEGNASDGGYKSFDDLSPSGKWSRLHKGRKSKDQTDLQAEFSTLTSSIFVLVVTAWNAPEGIKPNEDEINGVSNRCTRILLRHVDLSGRMTADVIDIIGIIAIGASYYSRVSPTLKQYQEWKKNASAPAEENNQLYQTSENNNGERPWITPIQEADPNMKKWLDGQADEG